uniref:Uncharacterized protein n=1 Tax=Arundo donax TaxID=35708 RepID=A0A0A9BD82_ARUDO
MVLCQRSLKQADENTCKIGDNFSQNIIYVSRKIVWDNFCKYHICMSKDRMG